MKRLFGTTREDLSAVAEILRSGDVVALPTETVYGLACLALDATAVAKVFATKKRPAEDPLIVHVEDASQAARVCETDERFAKLAEGFWPGPLTLVLPKRPCVPESVTAGLPTVAVRSPGHAVFGEVLRLVGEPLAAPSANLFGKVSPTRAEHVKESFGPDHPPVVDGGPTDIGIESTVLDLSAGEPRVLRPGPISRSAIEETLGEKVCDGEKAGGEPKAPGQKSPGLLAGHYQPKAPLRIFPDEEAMAEFLKESEDLPTGTVVLFHGRDDRSPDDLLEAMSLFLSEQGSPREIARNLYARLREADASDTDLILTHLCEETGIGRAVNDRLRRASEEN